MSKELIAFVSTQIITVPFLVVYIAGIILAFNRYPRQGARALFAGVGFCLFAIGWVITAGYMYWQMTHFQSDNYSIEELTRVVMVAGSLSRLAEFIGLILVMYAVFDTRTRLDGDLSTLRPVNNENTG